mmetsp:Transcript_23349/g.65580  ORF Transcript_23349/g.65580 Transcript_23349/m.65580 type:complete len:215 (-) Transcript_23349:112-756(-)
MVGKPPVFQEPEPLGTEELLVLAAGRDGMILAAALQLQAKISRKEEESLVMCVDLCAKVTSVSGHPIRLLVPYVSTSVIVSWMTKQEWKAFDGVLLPLRYDPDKHAFGGEDALYDWRTAIERSGGSGNERTVGVLLPPDFGSHTREEAEEVARKAARAFSIPVMPGYDEAGTIVPELVRAALQSLTDRITGPQPSRHPLDPAGWQSRGGCCVLL